jgi:hypothetical protein
MPRIHVQRRWVNEVVQADVPIAARQRVVNGQECAGLAICGVLRLFGGDEL